MQSKVSPLARRDDRLRRSLVYYYYYFSFRAGRYDSAERHCQNCAGFQEISSQNEAFPVAIMRSEYTHVQIIRTALADAENKKNSEISKPAMDSVRRFLAALFKDGLPAINYEEGESNSSGAITDPTAQPTAQPPTTSEPVFEPECVEWGSDTLQTTNFESNDVSGGIADHTPAPPPTMLEPVVDSESAVEWDFDMRAHAAPPPTTSEPVVDSESTGERDFGAPLAHATPPPTTSEPMFEPECVERDFDTLHMPNCRSNTSGGIVDHTASSPTKLEPVVDSESSDKWDFDTLVAYATPCGGGV